MKYRLNDNRTGHIVAQACWWKRSTARVPRTHPVLRAVMLLASLDGHTLLGETVASMWCITDPEMAAHRESMP